MPRKSQKFSQDSSAKQPIRKDPDSTWTYYHLWQKIREALYALPIHFRSDTFIEGIRATDIFTLNTALGATIENQFVDTLNQIRNIWDPERKFESLQFIRQSQSFPDVILIDSTQSNPKPILGIELKGWYLLAKEGEPSFRFTQTPNACANADLIVIVPWSLNNVISGRPKIFSPFIENAKYAAEYRNHWWQNIKESDGDSSIIIPSEAFPYPTKNQKTTDIPAKDGGGNFGRFSRCGLMDDYLETAISRDIGGIKAKHWIEFFKVFSEHSDDAEIKIALNKLKQKIAKIEPSTPQSLHYESSLIILAEIEKILGL